MVPHPQNSQQLCIPPNSCEFLVTILDDHTIGTVFPYFRLRHVPLQVQAPSERARACADFRSGTFVTRQLNGTRVEAATEQGVNDDYRHVTVGK